MKVNFVGGDDVQRSLNHSDSRCVNLIPSLNDKGDIAAFYKVDGLKSEGTLSGVPTGAYKASNGRAFYTSGTVLYELTLVEGVYTSTNRGTITTATTYRMSDNGIEMILVNGTDGWLFTFSTNTLLKIKVATADFTVTIADPAVFTKTDHGLVAGDALRLTTTTDSVISDTVLAALSPSSITSLGTSIAIAPANDYVYAAGGTTIYQFLRNTGTGLLSNLSPLTVTDSGNGIRNIVLSNDGVSAYTTSTTATSYIKTWDVSLATGQISASAFANNNLGTVAGVPYVAPADNFVYATDVVSGRIYQYERAVTGELTALSPAYITVTTPSKMCIPADGEFAYVLSGGNILVLDRDNTTGLITQTPVETKASGAASTADISLSSDDLFLYTANSAANNVSMFSRNASTGVLTALTGSPLSIGAIASSIVVSADDVSVYVANTTSATITMLIRDTSTGILTLADTPTIDTDTSPYDLVIAPDDNNVYTINGAGSISMFSRNATATQVGLPTGLAELTTYYVLAAGLTADAFTVSETAGGTAVSTSGQQAGIHTYTTLGYGFPEGAKTVSYMNGRFIACDPSTQDFYVSEVLDGKWWDALNVQTVDSNPDYVIGEIVSHNELIVFCDDSGEVFYDSGTVPTPFVRNSSGIFEVGCIAPYSICNLDNQVFWLGGNKVGKGIVYKLQGYTPLRISTHSIEYAIQSMSTTSDARAFAYQKDGHHYYVLTFPTGNKTFVYDVNTGLWHERAKTTPDAVVPSMTWTPATSSISDLWVYDIGWNGTVFCAIGMGYSDNSATTRCYTSTDGITWTARTMSVSSRWSAIAWNGTVFCAVGSLNASSDIAATSPDGITWTTQTMPASAAWTSIAWNGTVFCAVGYTYSGGYTSHAATSTDGVTWTARTMPSANGWSAIAWSETVFCAVAYGSAVAATSPDGITWTARTLPASSSWVRIAWNGTVFLASTGCTSASLLSSNISATSSDGITWTQRELPETANWHGLNAAGEVFCIVNKDNNNSYVSVDGISWTQKVISGDSGTWFNLGASDTIFTTIGGGTAPVLSAYTSSIVVPSTTYTLTEWPVNNHLYFNDEHLVTDSTTTLLSIDSATYKNGSEVMQYIRSFNVPTQNMNRTRHTRLQLDCEAGVASAEANITLKWSDDGAHTFNTGLDASLGITGEYSKRVVWHRLGMTKGQPRVYELSGASDSKVVLINVHLD